MSRVSLVRRLWYYWWGRKLRVFGEGWMRLLVDGGCCCRATDLRWIMLVVGCVGLWVVVMAHVIIVSPQSQLDLDFDLRLLWI